MCPYNTKIISGCSVILPENLVRCARLNEGLVAIFVSSFELFSVSEFTIKISCATTRLPSWHLLPIDFHDSVFTVNLKKHYVTYLTYKMTLLKPSKTFVKNWSFIGT